MMKTTPVVRASVLLWLLFLLVCATAHDSALPGCSAAAVAEVPFEITNHHIVIEGSVNQSRPIRMILDTGMVAGVLLNNEKIADEIGLVAVGRAPIRGGGDGEPIQAGVAMGARVDFGKAGLEGQMVIIVPSDSTFARLTEDLAYEGVIGYSVFQKYVVCIDHERSVLQLADPEKFQYSGQGRQVPITVEATKPYVMADVRIAEGEEISVRSVLDTGSGSALHLYVDTHPGIRLPDRSVDAVLGRTIDGFRTGKMGRIHNFRLAGYDMNNLLVAFPLHESTAPAQPRQALVGNRLLNQFHSIFDYSGQRLILEPNDRFGQPFEFTMSGITLDPGPRDGRYRIARVVEPSPASEASIREGDLLEAVDGKSVSDVPFGDVRDMLDGEEGQTLELKLVRDGEPYTVTIRLRRLI